MQNMSVPALMDRVPDDETAYLFLEELRWGDTPVCPHCGSIGGHYFLKARDDAGRKTRTGKTTVRRVWKCHENQCRKQFSVLTGTIFHGTKISIRTWVLVTFEMCASKNGVASREIERKYGLTPKSAWFMLHRIREAMKSSPNAALFSGTVTADETWIGGKPGNRHVSKRAGKNNYIKDDKTAVLSLVNRGTGEVRSQVVPNVTGATLHAAIEKVVDLPATVLHTDTAFAYTKIGWRAAGHETVNHRMSEYVRGDVTTNHAEGFFSQLKRSIDGTHHRVSVEHLPRYLAEFDFRYSTRKMSDTQRVQRLMGQTGRRLSYEPLIGG